MKDYFNQEDFRNERCNTCNSVSHAEIASDFGEFSQLPFYPDPLRPGSICHSCREAYHGALEDWSYENDDDDLIMSQNDEDDFDDFIEEDFDE